MAQVSVITTVGKSLIAARIQHTVPGGATNSPPTLGSEAPGRGVGMGTGATTGGADAAATDLSLVREVESRATGAETVTTNVYQTVGTQTATAARTIDEGGIFDSQSQSVTAAAQANAGATAINIGASNPFASSGTLYTYNNTSQAAGTPLGAQAVTFSSYSNPNLTVTALSGQINSGGWITSGNMYARVTLRSATITLGNGDSIQWTYQVTFS